jgi:hypothetical protein
MKRANCCSIAPLIFRGCSRTHNSNRLLASSDAAQTPLAKPGKIVQETALKATTFSLSAAGAIFQ